LEIDAFESGVAHRRCEEGGERSLLTEDARDTADLLDEVYGSL
jgi:hypothetical protein